MRNEETMNETHFTDTYHVTDASVDVQPQVRFFPALSEQRQLFLLNTLRSLGATKTTSILDIGCGEGSLLGILCRPSLALTLSPDFDGRYGIEKEPEVKSVVDKYEHWDTDRTAGLDLHEGTLEFADSQIRPIEDVDSDSSRWLKPRPRWSPLNVKLWKGGLQHFNPEFQTYNIIFSSEVIEHLPEDVLNSFCPMILGRYAPEVLAITTPNYEFNQLFTSPPSPSSSPSPSLETATSLSPLSPSSTTMIREGGYLDPSGRTNRVFRHLDHKFEWTREEFTDWCVTQAMQWGYTVEIGGVGQSVERDPWGRDERDNKPYKPGEAKTSLGSDQRRLGLYASQTAVFRRMENNRDKHLRRFEASAQDFIRKCLEDPSTVQSNGGGACEIRSEHQLFREYTHPVHSSLSTSTSAPAPISLSSSSTDSESSLSHKDILQKVKETMSQDLASGEVSMFDLWNCDEVAIVCRGSLEKLYEVFESAGASGIIGTHGGQVNPDPNPSNPPDEWEWVEPKRYARWARLIRWKGYVSSSNSNGSTGWMEDDDDLQEDVWEKNSSVEGDIEMEVDPGIPGLERSKISIGWDNTGGWAGGSDEGWGANDNVLGYTNSYSGWGSPKCSSPVGDGHGHGWGEGAAKTKATGNSNGGWGWSTDESPKTEVECRQ